MVLDLEYEKGFSREENLEVELEELGKVGGFSGRGVDRKDVVSRTCSGVELGFVLFMRTASRICSSAPVISWK